MGGRIAGTPDPKPERPTEPFQRLPKASFGGIPMSYYERVGPALEHEEKVLQWLRYEGCIAEPWGQALFPIAFQDALRACQDADGNPVLLRWFPDIIALVPPLAFLIDAKQGARHRDTGKHAIEQSSLKAMLILEKALNISAWFILPGGAGISAQEADRVKEPGTFLGQGSGTPFWLICNEFTIGNDVLFEQMKLPIRNGRFHCDIPCQYAIDDDGKYCYSFCPKCRAITSPKLRP